MELTGWRLLTARWEILPKKRKESGKAIFGETSESLASVDRELGERLQS
jgi:hypothetical protein